MRIKPAIFLGLVFAFILAGWLIGGCRKKEPEAVIVGCTLPLSGDAAVWGTSQKEGYDLALDDINSNPAYPLKIMLLYEDDKGLAKDGVSALNKLVYTNKIKFLTGVANSSVALAYIPIINKNNILFISSGASSPKLTGVSNLFFRTWPSDNAEAVAIAKYASKDLKLAEIGILFINNDYGIGLKEPFENTFRGYGGKITSAESFDQATTDFRTQITKILKDKPQGIYVAGNPREMARCIQQLREAGYKGQILSISTLNDPEITDLLSTGAIDGTVITDVSVDFTDPAPLRQAFLKKFKAKYKKDPGVLAATAYDALTLLAVAINNVGADPIAVSRYFKNVKGYEGVSGPISFSEGGDVVRPVRVSKAKDGKFYPVVKDYKWQADQ